MFPTEKDIETVKAAHPAAELELIETDDYACIARHATRTEYEAYIDGSSRKDTAAAARWNLIVTCVAWPPVAEIRRLRERWPASPDRLTDGFDMMAGAETKAVLVDTLTEAERAELVEQGVPLEALLARYHHKGQLAVARTARGPMLFKTPTLAAFESYSRNIEQTASSAYLIALDSTVWPEAPALIFDALPAVPLAVRGTLATMAGCFREVRRKKI